MPKILKVEARIIVNVSEKNVLTNMCIDLVKQMVKISKNASCLYSPTLNLRYIYNCMVVVHYSLFHPNLANIHSNSMVSLLNLGLLLTFL